MRLLYAISVLLLSMLILMAGTVYADSDLSGNASSNESQNSSLNASLDVNLNDVNLSAVILSPSLDVFQTDFENYEVGVLPPEFRVQYSGKGLNYVTTDGAHSGSKSLQVWGNPGWCGNIVYDFEKPECGRIGYEVWLKANPKEEGWVQFVNPEGAQWSWGWGGVQFNQEGYIGAEGGYTKAHTEDKWYKVRAEMDVETGATWIWLDDELVTDGITPAMAGRENPDAYKGIRGVIFGDCSWYESPSTPTYFDDFRFYTKPSHKTVSVDVKPGSCPNPINSKSKGVIPIAILGTEDFDVTTIDPVTIKLSREGVTDDVSPIRWNYDDVATPFAGELCDCNELGGDGNMDLMLHFDVPTLVAQLRLGDLIGGTIPLKVTGKLRAENDETPFEGRDCVKILK
jgi:hypothetical protein